MWVYVLLCCVDNGIEFWLGIVGWLLLVHALVIVVSLSNVVSISPFFLVSWSLGSDLSHDIIKGN
jgi:hypothetical protein